MKRDILTSSLQNLKNELEKAKNKRNQYSEKLKNMDCQKTFTSSRVKARINLTCQCEEVDRIEKKIDFVKEWIEEVSEKRNIAVNMKANKKTLIDIKEFLKEEKNNSDLEGLILEISEETNLLKSEEMGEYSISLDELGIVWGANENICTLEKFINDYTRIFIEKICNILDSFKETDMTEKRNIAVSVGGVYDEFVECKIGQCPECTAVVIQGSGRYCTCGQKIDWED